MNLQLQARSVHYSHQMHLGTVALMSEQDVEEGDCFPLSPHVARGVCTPFAILLPLAL